jgi:hypothetical protein
MTQAFRHRNYGVYILNERGERHHLPHAHVKERSTLICTINLLTLKPLQKNKKIPADLRERLEEEQEAMLKIWKRLNDDDD